MFMDNCTKKDLTGMFCIAARRPGIQFQYKWIYVHRYSIIDFSLQ